MAKIDKVKESLNTLRLLFSLGIGLIVILTGALIGKEQANQIDMFFWIGITLTTLIIAGLFVVVNYIRKLTNSIEDL